MNQNFAIGIPTINQWELLRPFLLKYLVNFPVTDIYIVDNGNQAIDVTDINLMVIKNKQPASVAASWNQLCKLIFKKCSHALLLNDDIFLNKTDADIYKLLQLYGNDAFVVSQQGFCSFLLPKKTFQQVGGFDENFLGAYFEDRDYERRLKLAAMDITWVKALNPSVYNESSSIKKDPSLNANYQHNATYYFNKWGGNLNGEIFSKPFNK